MKDALILEHKTYISARRAAEITGYTSDYVGQLCRAGKIESKIVARSWFVLEESLLKHKLINDEVKTNKKTAKKRRALRAQAALPQIPGVQFISKNEIQVGVALLPEKTQENIPVKIIAPIVVPIKKDTEVKSDIKIIKEKEIETPFLPLLTKSGKDVSVKFVPYRFSMRSTKGAPLVHVAAFELHPVAQKISRKNLADKKSTETTKVSKRSATTSRNISASAIALHPRESFAGNFAAVALLLIVIAGGGFFMMKSSFAPIAQNFTTSGQASIGSVTKDIIDSVARGFNGVTHKIAMFLGIDSSSSKNNGTLAVNNSNPSNEDLGFSGIAVVPSTNSSEKDELVKERIRASFSDEVKVQPDKSGTAGVITPVFKKATKDNFVYVLVPIQETRQ
jgi:hypothetical protein